MSTYNAGQSETKNDFGPTTKIAAKEGPIVNEDLLEKEDKGERPIGDGKHSGDRGAKTGKKRARDKTLSEGSIG